MRHFFELKSQDTSSEGEKVDKILGFFGGLEGLARRQIDFELIRRVHEREIGDIREAIVPEISSKIKEVDSEIKSLSKKQDEIENRLALKVENKTQESIDMNEKKFAVMMTALD